MRHNHVPVPWVPGLIVDITVTEDYTYNGRDGRASAKRTTLNNSNYEFTQSFIWDELGNLASQTYPSCGHETCTQSAGANPPRALSNIYTMGFLTNVPGFGSLTYHHNFLVHQVHHTNGVTDTQDNDPWLRRRPYAIRTSVTPVVLGPYHYDGAGNITAIGGNQMLYDKVSRLVDLKFESGQSQDYSFDVYGNLTQITTDAAGPPVTRTMPVAGTTNRLSGAAYDAAGNVTSWGGYQYSYDPFGMHVRMQGGGNDKVYFPSSTNYTADDERIYALAYEATQGPAGNEETWTLRGLDGKVLREWQMSGGNAVGNWSLTKDYIHRDGQLLAHVTGAGATVHYTLDHLGSPRVLTSGTGGILSDHHYYGFGEELIPKTSDPMKFTGHERDFNAGSGTTDDLDYMHARYYSPHLGRFLSVDPAMESADPFVPQSWNRFGYAFGNPLSYVDPDGESPAVVLVAVAIVGGVLFGAEAANAPTSAEEKLIPNTGGLKAIRGASIALTAIGALSELLGFGDSDSAVPEGGEESQNSESQSESGGPNSGLERQLQEHQKKLACIIRDAPSSG